MDFTAILIAVLLAAAISIAASRVHALDLSGAIAAFVVGSIVFGVGTWSASTTLILFFISGSALSALRSKETMIHQKPRRDWKQVVANGWLAAMASLLILIRPASREELSALFLGSIATAAADTFATEIGTRFGKRAVSISTFQHVETGTSGGISGAGTLGSLTGALVIAGGFAATRSLGNLCEFAGINWFLPLMISGFAGALFDSWLGATLQGRYRCTQCGKIVEVRRHCDEETIKISGVTWMGNNAVNAISVLLGGMIFLAFL